MDDCHGPKLALEAGGQAGEAKHFCAARCILPQRAVPTTVYLCGCLPSGRDDLIGSLLVQNRWHFNANFGCVRFAIYLLTHQLSHCTLPSFLMIMEETTH